MEIPTKREPEVPKNKQMSLPKMKQIEIYPLSLTNELKSTRKKVTISF